MLPHDQAASLPPMDVDLTLQTDAMTLRPAQLVVDATSDDGAVDIHAVIDASEWDGDVVIDEPVEGVATPDCQLTG